jgi:hypothetical protein
MLISKSNLVTFKNTSRGFNQSIARMLTFIQSQEQSPIIHIVERIRLVGEDPERQPNPAADTEALADR